MAVRLMAMLLFGSGLVVGALVARFIGARAALCAPQTVIAETHQPAAGNQFDHLHVTVTVPNFSWYCGGSEPLRIVSGQ